MGYIYFTNNRWHCNSLWNNYSGDLMGQRQYIEQGSSMIWVWLILFILVAGSIVFAVDYFNWAQIPVVNNINNLIKQTRQPKITTLEIVNPPEDVGDWCKPQVIMQSGAYMADSVVIQGWDKNSNCCLWEIKGNDACRGGKGILRFCPTSDVGGVIKYATYNGYYIQPEAYKAFKTMLEGRYIQENPCQDLMYAK